VSVLFQGRAKS